MSTKSTVWNVSKYWVFSGLYFPAFGMNPERYFVSLRIQSKCGNTLYLSGFSPNMGKYGPEKTRYLDIFHTVKVIYTQTNVQLKVAGLFRYVWSFSGERLYALLLNAYHATETISSSLSFLYKHLGIIAQPVFTCSKSTMKA